MRGYVRRTISIPVDVDDAIKVFEKKHGTNWSAVAAKAFADHMGKPELSKRTVEERLDWLEKTVLDMQQENWRK